MTNDIIRPHEEARIIRLALSLEEHGGVRVSDTTSTIASLTRVSPGVRRLLEAAADLAGVSVEIAKVGDEARARVIA